MIKTRERSSITTAWGLDALVQVRDGKRAHSETVAVHRDDWIRTNDYFYSKLKRLLQFIVEPGKRVLEVQCQTGHLLASVQPSYGVGVEISRGLVQKARHNFPGLNFVQSDPEDLALGETFDYIIFSHIFDTVDILTALGRLRRHCTKETRLLVVNYNPLWQPLLDLATKLKMRAPFVQPNWVSEGDIRGFLYLAGFHPLRTHHTVLVPKRIPLLSDFLNEFVARMPGVRRLACMQVLVARPEPEPVADHEISVSVIVPCRNEFGNVQPAVERIPQMGCHTEIIFCDDKSSDGTPDEVQRMQALYPEKDIRLVEGPAICKAENVWTGFRAARGDVLMILDADLTVMPEELPTFFNALASGRGEFINGSRLVYPMQRQAMKFANMIGNKLFGVAFSFLLDQRIKDTLCGTKVLWRRDWERMQRSLGSWGIRDLWGDYELLFGASKLHLEIAEMPVHYQERVYGVTKMTKVFSNGMRMLRICWHAGHRLGG